MSKSTDLTDQLFDDKINDRLDPFEVFSQWLLEAHQNEVNDANAMTLSTLDEAGMPDSRIMLLNGQDERGFIFYTNSNSIKGMQLDANPKAALLFHWKTSRRAVRIRGGVVKVSAEIANAYFATRPRGSQLGAHASFQSQPLHVRDDLIDRIEQITAKYEGQDVPRPDHWNGYRVEPLRIEFWQDGEFRLHNRVAFNRDDLDTPWSAQVLNP